MTTMPTITLSSTFCRLYSFLTVFLLLHNPSYASDEGEQGVGGVQTCASWTGSSCTWEPNLKAMEVDLGYTKVSFYAYVPPDVSSYYNDTTTKGGVVKKMKNTGMFGKFINLSPDPIHVYWDGGKGSDLVYISTVEPFGSAGTATYPSHKFVVTPTTTTKTILTKWQMQAGNSLYYYDPFDFNYDTARKALTEQQLPLYHLQLTNRVFAEQYKRFTGGTDWLALYGQKLAPRYHMHRADAIGQTHTITTNEIHFVETPPADVLQRGTSIYGPRPDEKSNMRPYRHREPTLDLQLKVLSCAPRVFEIQNFLSEFEVQHIVNNIAANTELHRSSVKASGGSDATSTSNTRTSTNNWIKRNHDIITDTIYQRAADVLQINEALLRWRHKFEVPEFTESTTSIAERLQLVHYGVGEKYSPHHDFTMPGMVHHQPARFATLLLYLNDDMEGGETAFPIWRNRETSEALLVKPEVGKAVLFYNVLPDGNFDQLSLHEARPVTKGEKLLTNLWVWDPILDHTATDRF